MKAIRVREFGGPEVRQLEDMPDPRPLQSEEVLITVKAAGEVSSPVQVGLNEDMQPQPHHYFHDFLVEIAANSARETLSPRVPHRPLRVLLPSSHTFGWLSRNQARTS
jgi:NADPH:quinone reductase-like Zn-dependent oxidoreductase